MTIAFISREEALSANPWLAHSILGFQKEAHPSRDSYEVGQEVWLGDDQATVLDEKLCRELNDEHCREFDAKCDHVPAPEGDFTMVSRIIAAGEGSDIDSLLEDNARAWAELSSRMGWDDTIFLGWLAAPLVEQENEYPPLVAARERLFALGLKPDYAGAIAADREELVTLVRDLFALERYNASGTYISFAGRGGSTVATFCQYCNFHFETFSPEEDERLVRLLPECGMTIAEGGACDEPFGEDDLIEGRRLDLN